MDSAENSDNDRLYESFDNFWKFGQYEEAIRIYEALGRPYWFAQQIGQYFEETNQLDFAMYEYQRVMDAYFDTEPRFLPFPGGPVELYKLGKWLSTTDPYKAEKYLRLYVQADDINRGEPLKTIYRAEAMQLLEVLMTNKHVYIQKQIEELEHCPDVVPLRGLRTVPDAMSLALHSKSRVGLWWYQPLTGEMFFSISAGHHLKLSEFVGIKDVRGGARGAIFEKDDLNYLLIYKCDLVSEALEGRILMDIFKQVQGLSGLEIDGGIVDEEGRDLLGNMQPNQGL